MNKGLFVGDFELLVLLALVRLGPDTYGGNVRREIEIRAGRSASAGATYATLDRLEAKGLVRSALSAPRRERGGRARRRFELTVEGRCVVARTHRSLANMTDGLDLSWPEAGAFRSM